MKHNKYIQNNLAAGVVLLLAVILIAACTPPTTPSPTKIAATTVLTNTPTLILLTDTATSSPPPSPQPPTTTSTSTSTPTATSEPPTLTPIPITATATPLPPPTQQPTPLPTPLHQISSNGIEVYEVKITLPTYPIKDYLTEQIDPIYNIPVFYFDRSAFEAAAPFPTPVNYTGVVLENPYLRLTFIPELGGRLYSAIIKATNQEVFYHNPVVKPSRYGILQPPEANWWLAMGGMEWAYPTQEHGYRFGVAWDYTITSKPNQTTITLSDTAPDRAGVTVDVTLPIDKASFITSPKLVNNGSNNVPVQLWINAALALTSGSMSPKTQFVLPAKTVTVHSRGESGWTVPGERQQASWPQVDETDLRDYRQWANYLGFFVPNQEVPFIGAYNPNTNIGIVRLATPEATSGSGKLFAFGLDFPDRSYTDDGSQYFEIWGGVNAGFWPKDDIMVLAGQTLGWTESWWPLAQLNGLTWATDRISIYLSQAGNNYTLSALVVQPTQGKLQISTEDNTLLLSEAFSANPTTPLHWNFTAADTPITIQFMDNQNTKLLDYQLIETPLPND